MSQIIYKSKYALICELVDLPKPSTQEEEDYCQIVERETDTWIKVHTELLTEYIKKINDKKNPPFKGTWRESLHNLLTNKKLYQE